MTFKKVTWSYFSLANTLQSLPAGPALDLRPACTASFCGPPGFQGCSHTGHVPSSSGPPTCLSHLQSCAFSVWNSPLALHLPKSVGAQLKQDTHREPFWSPHISWAPAVSFMSPVFFLHCTYHSLCVRVPKTISAFKDSVGLTD